MITNFEYLGKDKLYAFTGHHQALVSFENDQSIHSVFGFVFDDNCCTINGYIKGAELDLMYHLTDNEWEQLDDYMQQSINPLHNYKDHS